MCLKFIPQMPASAVGTAKIAAHAEIFFVHFGFADRDQPEIHLQRGADHVANAVDRLIDPIQVVVDVAK